MLKPEGDPPTFPLPVILSVSEESLKALAGVEILLRFAHQDDLAMRFRAGEPRPYGRHSPTKYIFPSLGGGTE